MFDSLKKLLGISTIKIDFKELSSQGATILDVRTKSEFSNGHIKGSTNIPLDQLAGKTNKLNDKDYPIITCCASGARSASAKALLIAKGFTNVHNGGGWMSLNRKLN